MHACVHAPFGMPSHCGLYWVRAMRCCHPITHPATLPPCHPDQEHDCTALPAARAVMLGYNVMAIDTDTIVLGDFYARVKSPPLRAFTMISQSEYSDSINGGFSYIQGAQSNGPTAHLLFSAVYRIARCLCARGGRFALCALDGVCDDDAWARGIVRMGRMHPWAGRQAQSLGPVTGPVALLGRRT